MIDREWRPVFSQVVTTQRGYQGKNWCFRTPLGGRLAGAVGGCGRGSTTFLLAEYHSPAILCRVGAKAVLETAVVDGGASVNGAAIAADSPDTNGTVSAALGCCYHRQWWRRRWLSCASSGAVGGGRTGILFIIFVNNFL